GLIDRVCPVSDPGRRGTSSGVNDCLCLHMTASCTEVAGAGNRITDLRGQSLGLNPMLRPQGGSSHVASADTPPCEVTLTGLSVTPITGAHWLHPLEPVWRPE